MNQNAMQRTVTRPESVSFLTRSSALGIVLVAHTSGGRALRAVQLGDDADTLRAELAERFPRATLVHEPRSPMGAQLADAVLRLLDAPGRAIDAPLDLRGTAFQQKVWNALREIPVGSTATYTEIARRIGSPNSVRAVAGACAANPLALAVPCHRVVRSDGGLSGYRWGVERKRTLLRLEGALT